MAGEARIEDDLDTGDALVPDQDIGDVAGPQTRSSIVLAKRHGTPTALSVWYYILTSGTVYKQRISKVAQRLCAPKLSELLRRFLREELYPGFDEPDDVVIRGKPKIEILTL